MKNGVYVGLSFKELDQVSIYNLVGTRYNNDLLINEITINCSYAGNYLVSTVALILSNYQPVKISNLEDNNGKLDIHHKPIPDSKYISFHTAPKCNLTVLNKLKEECTFKYIGKYNP